MHWGGGGGFYNWMYFFGLLVDGPITGVGSLSVGAGGGGDLSESLCDNSGHHNKFSSSEWNQSLQVQTNPPFLILVSNNKSFFF